MVPYVGNFLMAAGRLFHALTTELLNACFTVTDIGGGDGSANSDMAEPSSPPMSAIGNCHLEVSH